MALFNREYELILGEPGKEGILIRDLRVTFQFKLDHGKSPNEGIVRVYNAARATITAIANMVNYVGVFRAGYTGQLGTVFVGEITRVEEYLDGVDRVVEIYLRDSLVALRDSKTALSFPPGTSGSAVVQSVAANFGLPLKMRATGADRQLTHGYAFNGRTRNALSEICQFLGLEWSAQQGEIMVINKGGVYADQAVVLSPDTGLIGAPKPVKKSMTDKRAAKAGIQYGQDGVRRYTKTDPTAKVKNRQMLDIEGYKVKALLNANIMPGSYVQLQARATEGDAAVKQFFRVEVSEFTGDSHSGDWLVDAELRYPSQGTAHIPTKEEEKAAREKEKEKENG